MDAVKASSLLCQYYNQMYMESAYSVLTFNWMWRRCHCLTVVKNCWVHTKNFTSTSPNSSQL